MNIFFTNENPLLAANDHCHIHTNKMIIEYAQILSAAHHILDGENALQGIYKKTHQNHPSAVWVRSGQYQYEWVLDCAVELCKMYTLRTGKVHKTEAVLNILKDLPDNLSVTAWKNPPVAAPDKFKAVAVFQGAAIAYQEYMKEKLAEWLTRDKPLKVEFLYTPEWI